MSAPLPLNESQRLEALRRYDILDTLPEQAYDDIVALAAKIAETPIALVSLVDGNRQWFKSSVGLDLPELNLDPYPSREVYYEAQLTPGGVYYSDDSCVTPTTSVDIPPNGGRAVVYIDEADGAVVDDVGPTNSKFLLEKNELIHLCTGMEVLVYREEGKQGDTQQGWRNQAMIIAKRINQ